MSVIKCPTNCDDHDYFFPHSMITATRVVNREIVVIEMIVCRECGHWISNRAVVCNCRFACHEEEGGVITMTSDNSLIDCP